MCGDGLIPDAHRALARLGVLDGDGGELLAQGVGLALIAIVVLQNVESTSLDVLFWTVSELPKLVVIFLAMIVGALVWEILRRTWLR